MRADIVSLTFPHGFHVGAHGVGTESVRATVPSDTLFSALLATWVRLGRDPAAWSTSFPRTIDGQTELVDPPFLLSSALPLVAGIPFYPKPLGIQPEDVPPDKRKQWNRVQFLSESVFTRLRARSTRAGVWPESDEAERCQLLQGGSLLVAAEEVEHIPPDVRSQGVWAEEDVPRVSLDRMSSASNLFSVGRVRFAPGCGLWFAVVWLEPDRDCGGVTFKRAFEFALAELGETGLGGDRTVGYGRFIPEVLDTGLHWDDRKAGDRVVLLSRYHPRPDELPRALTTAHAYQLEYLAGWGTSSAGSFRRRGLWLLSEGSVLQQHEAPFMGDLVDLSPVGEGNPGHPVWRYGLALGLPMEVRGAEED